MTAATPSRLKTAIVDSLGLMLVVWSIPVAIIVIGLPFALLLLGARMIANMIW